MDPLDLRDKHVFLAGQFVALPRRRLKTFLKGIGAHVILCDQRWYPPQRQPRHPGRTRRIDLILLGTVTEGHRSFYPRAAHHDALYMEEQDFLHAYALEEHPQGRLERLRDLAHQDPLDDDTWYQLCCILEGCPSGPDLQLAVDYLQHRDLPNTRRLALPRWLERAANGHDEPRLLTARGVALQARDGLGFLRFAASKLAHLSHVDLAWDALDRLDLAATTSQSDLLPSITLRITPPQTPHYTHPWYLNRRLENLAALAAHPFWKQRIKLVEIADAAFQTQPHHDGNSLLKLLRSRWKSPIPLHLA